MSTSPTERSFVRFVGALGLAVVLAAGCSPSTQPSSLEAADEVLTGFVTDATQLAGYEVNPSEVSVRSGNPPQVRRLFAAGKVLDRPSEPVDDPAWPYTVPAQSFPLKESLERVHGLAEDCAGESVIRVWALAEGLVTTEASCDTDGGETHTATLGDEPLTAIDTPFTGSSVEQLWAEVQGAGLRLTRVEVDAERMAVFFAKTSVPDRYFQWNRGLNPATSSVSSHPLPWGASFDASQVPAAALGQALDGLLATVDASDVALVDVSPTDQGVLRLKLLDSGWNELAATDLQP